MVTWHKLGAHRYYRDGDVVFVELHGDFLRDDAKGVWDVSDAVEQELGYALSVFDARMGMSVSPQARTYINERKAQHQTTGAVTLIGASFPLRTLLGLMQQATRLLLKKAPTPLYFCAAPEELPAVLALQRKSFKKRPRDPEQDQKPAAG